MAIGFLPKHSQTSPLGNLSKDHYLVIALETAKRLKWDIGYVSEDGFLAYTSFTMISWGEEIKVKLDDNEAVIKSEVTGNQLFDWGKNKSNVKQFLSKFSEIKAGITQDEILIKSEELKQELSTKPENSINENALNKTGKITDFLSIFKPTKDFFVTPILLNINILVFLLMIFSGVDFIQPDGESLIKWGANFRTNTLEGEWWRLLSSCFLHIGVIHLLFNMYALLYIGLLLEPYLGRVRFLTAYIFTGIAASTVSLWWHNFTVSAGASGAIFGLYGVFFAMLTTNLIEKSARKNLMTSIGVFIVYNLINGLNGDVDNAAHLGGLISGLIIGYSFYPTLVQPNKQKLKNLTNGVIVVIISIGSFIVYKSLPNDLLNYDAKMEEFVAMESMALEFYNLPSDTPTEEMLVEIKDRGIYYWKENIKLLEDMNKEMNLPDHIYFTNLKLIQYCKLRLKSYKLIYKAVEQNTDVYVDSIEYYYQEIDATINSLQQN